MSSFLAAHIGESTVLGTSSRRALRKLEQWLPDRLEILAVPRFCRRRAQNSRDVFVL